MYTGDKDAWYNPNREYVVNTTIYEYDIESAGLNILRNTIGEKRYLQLSILPKQERNVAIGKMIQKDPNLADIQREGFINIRKWFLKENNIADNDIISVKKDALFITKVCHNLEHSGLSFRVKNVYTSYIRFRGNVEVYHSDGRLDIKGLGEYAESVHLPYMTKFIQESLQSFENKDRRYIRKTMKFLDEYRRGELSEYYPQYKPSSEYDPAYNIQNIIIPLIQIGMKVI
jgi:hypothetical protein